MVQSICLTSRGSEVRLLQPPRKTIKPFILNGFSFMNKFYIYILKSNLGFHYIGQTSNLLDRLNRHNSNRSKYTKNKGVWELAASYEVPTRAEAVQLESKLKKFKNFSKALDYILQLSKI